MYLIIGGNGFLGINLIRSILRNTNEEVIATVRTPSAISGSPKLSWQVCDITDFSAVKRLASQLSEYQLKVIVCAAYHNPDAVQENPQIAWNINVTALANLLNQLRNVECLYYPSSDSVYGESIDGHLFKETDATNPVNLYGRQKVVAEQIILGYGHHVARFPFLIGHSFVPNRLHFYDKIVETLQRKEPIEMFSDSYRSALDFETAANLLIFLMESSNIILPPILNISSDHARSKYEIGLMIAEKMGISVDLIKPISMKNTQDIFKAKRANSTLMDNTMLKKLLNLSEIQLRL